MQEFLDRFPEHQQFSAVQDYYNSLKGQRDEQQFLKSLNNDLDLLPIAKITLSQILKSDTSSPREKITQLNHFITLYAARKDDEVASECVLFARKTIKRLEMQEKERQQELEKIHLKTEVEIREMLRSCRQIGEENSAYAIDLLEAIYEIHKTNEELSDILNEVLELRNELND